MKAFKGPAKQLGFLNFIPGLVSGATSMLGGIKANQDVQQGRDDVLNLPGMEGPPKLGGNFGTTQDGQFQADAGMQAQQAQLGQGTQGMLSGGQGFNNQQFQSAYGNNDLGQFFSSQQDQLGQQMGGSVFGGAGQQFNNSQGLSNAFAGQVAAGPQDLSGGFQNSMFNQGFQNQQNAADQSALYNQSLSQQREAFAPEAQRQQNAVEQSLFNKGMLGAGSTATGEAFRGLMEAQGAQDRAFQDNAFGRAFQQQQFLGNMGQQQMGMGSQLMGQNLGQFNQNVGNFLNTQQGAAGIEGQQFGQNLQANQFNNNAGQQRLQNSLGLFSQGNDMFNQSFGLGLQGAGQGMDMRRFGLDAASMPFQLQAGLLGAGGEHASALTAGASERAASTGGMFGGIADGLLGGLGKIFG